MSLSCSSAFRNVSRSSLSERDGGRAIGGRIGGSCDGEEGLDLERDWRRAFIRGEVGPVDMMGEGAWIWIDIAKVACARLWLTRRLVGGLGEVVKLCEASQSQQMAKGYR